MRVKTGPTMLPLNNIFIRGHMKGFFKPKNTSKYKGNVNNIVYRSSLEFRYMCWLDDSKKVLKWSSEEIYVPYRDKATGRHRLYYPDFWYITQAGQYLIEIKPARQCKPPVKRNTKTYVNEMRTFITNASKWDAAKKFATNRGMDFIILTEFELNNLNK